MLYSFKQAYVKTDLYFEVFRVYLFIFHHILHFLTDYYFDNSIGMSTATGYFIIHFTLSMLLYVFKLAYIRDRPLFGSFHKYICPYSIHHILQILIETFTLTNKVQTKMVILLWILCYL